MHWVLQQNLHQERGHDDLIAALARAGLPYSEHKVIPFIGQIEPDVSPAGPVIVMGTYSMRRVADRKGWTPGCFDVGAVPYAEQVRHWGPLLLNADATVCSFGSAHPTIDQFFIRPTADSKYFAGTVMSISELSDWQHKVVGLGEDDGTGLRSETEILWCAPKQIDAEYRLWVIDGKVVTASLYRRNFKPWMSADVEDGAIAFGNAVASVWSPLRAFVLDVCRVGDDWKIIEINTLNASGFYAADLNKLVYAIEGMGYNNQLEN